MALKLALHRALVADLSQVDKQNLKVVLDALLFLVRE